MQNDQAVRTSRRWRASKEIISCNLFLDSCNSGSTVHTELKGVKFLGLVLDVHRAKPLFTHQHIYDVGVVTQSFFFERRLRRFASFVIRSKTENMYTQFYRHVYDLSLLTEICVLQKKASPE